MVMTALGTSQPLLQLQSQLRVAMSLTLELPILGNLGSWTLEYKLNTPCPIWLKLENISSANLVKA